MRPIPGNAAQRARIIEALGNFEFVPIDIAILWQSTRATPLFATTQHPVDVTWDGVTWQGQATSGHIMIIGMQTPQPSGGTLQRDESIIQVLDENLLIQNAIRANPEGWTLEFGVLARVPSESQVTFPLWFWKGTVRSVAPTFVSGTGRVAGILATGPISRFDDTVSQYMSVDQVKGTEGYEDSDALDSVSDSNNLRLGNT